MLVVLLSACLEPKPPADATEALATLRASSLTPVTLETSRGYPSIVGSGARRDPDPTEAATVPRVVRGPLTALPIPASGSGPHVSTPTATAFTRVR